MKAQQFLDGSLSGYAPDTLIVMRDAFDQAWSLIEPKYRKSPTLEAARLMLADAVVDVSPRTGADVDTVRRMAMDLFLILERDQPL